jgi:hypothetical protein
MSKSKYITLSSSIPMYNTLLEHLEKIIDTNSNYSSDIVIAVKKGYEKLKLYYAKTDESNVYPIATSNYHFLKYNILLHIFYSYYLFI